MDTQNCVAEKQGHGGQDVEDEIIKRKSNVKILIRQSVGKKDHDVMKCKVGCEKANADEQHIRSVNVEVVSTHLRRGVLRYKLFHIVFGLACCAMTIGLSGCGEGGSVERVISPPPLTITFRESLLDSSTRVMQLTNRSGSESLVARVEVRNEAKGQRAAHMLKVAPGATEELGWMEMLWVFVPGEKFDVRCDGYSRIVSGTVP